MRKLTNKENAEHVELKESRIISQWFWLSKMDEQVECWRFLFIVHSRNGEDLQIPQERQRQQPVPPHAAIIQVRDAIHRPESDFTMPPFFLEK